MAGENIIPAGTPGSPEAGVTPPATGAPAGPVVNPDGTPAAVTTYTQEEFEAKLKSESDRRVGEALKTAQTKFDEKLITERKEADRLARLSEVERLKEEEKQRVEKIAERERDLDMRDIELDAIAVLDEKKLPVKFAKVLRGETAESTLVNIQTFETEWRAAVDAEVTLRLKGTTPKGPLGDETGKVNMNDFIRGKRTI